MSTIKANDLQNASGGIPTVKGQRLIPTAWVNFNMVTTSIRDSDNVSSIADIGVGRFQINFATAMANANYGYAASGWSDRVIGSDPGYNPLTTAININSYNTATAYSDSQWVGLVVLGGQA